MALDVEAGALTPELLVYGVVSAVDPQVSPDGTRLVYGLGRGDPQRPAERPTSSLWTSAVDGSDARPLTDPGHRDGTPRWSPDGSRIAFVTDRLGSPALVTIPATGGDPTKLAQHDLGINWLTWSPDGTQIAYSVTLDPETATAGPDPLVRVTRRLDYKEDVRGYLGDRRTQIFVVPAAGGEPRRLSTGVQDHWFPAWSPDGKTLAYRVSERVGIRYWLRLQEVSSGAARDVSIAEDGTTSLYSFSPSGDRLFVAADPGRTSQPDLFLVDVATGAATRLTDDLPVVPDAGYPSSVPPSPPIWLDEKVVLFHGVHRGASNLYTFDVESKELTALTSWEAAKVGFSVDARATKVVQSHADLGSLGEISVWDRGSGETAIVTHHNDELLAAHPPARWERIEFERAGFTIDSWLFFPPGFDRTKRYPLILDVHGGPHGHHGFGFQAGVETLATKGYLVLTVNPRGSGTYGRAFATAVIRDWGGEDYLDLQAAVDLVAGRDYVDEDRVGICGYSYGGFMTSYTIGRTHRYKAAVCGAPCFDLVSMFGSSDISPFWGQIQWGSKPWENPDWYREHSPSTRAHTAVTPTLIVHGEADNRCPIGQGEEMFTALSQAGVDVEFVRYPGAAHLFARLGPMGQREDYLERRVDWFDRHL
ncbi:MAG: S9 family peptidase [Candidatus Dormibacteraceae bacterium]